MVNVHVRSIKHVFRMKAILVIILVRVLGHVTIKRVMLATIQGEKKKKCLIYHSPLQMMSSFISLYLLFAFYFYVTNASLGTNACKGKEKGIGSLDGGNVGNGSW